MTKSKLFTVNFKNLLILNLKNERKMKTIMQRIRFILNERGGLIGLYRGLGPGTCRSFLANGSAMVVMQYAQRKVTEWGLRD